MLLRRECLEEVGLFDETIDFGEEYDMWIRISHSYDFAFIAEPLVRYSVHGTRLSTNYAVMIRGVERQLDKHRDFFAAYPADCSRRYIELGSLYCHAWRDETGEGRVPSGDRSGAVASEALSVSRALAVRFPGLPHGHAVLVVSLGRCETRDIGSAR